MNRAYFISYSQNYGWMVFYRTSGLTKQEAEVLVKALDDYFDEEWGDTCAAFRLEPSVEEDPARFVLLMSDWEQFFAEVVEGDNRRLDSHLYYRTAEELARHVVEMRRYLPRRHLLLVNFGHGDTAFNCVDNLTDAEVRTLGSVLGQELYEHGGCLDILAEDEATSAAWIRYYRQWELFEEELSQGDRDLEFKGLWQISQDIIGDILERRDRYPDEDESEEWIPEEQSSEVATPAESTANSAVLPAPEPRLKVTLDPPQAILDATPYALQQDGAIFIHALLQADGEWVAGTTLNMRAERVKKALPVPIRNLVESASGKGHRIPRRSLAQLRQEGGETTPK